MTSISLIMGLKFFLLAVAAVSITGFLELKLWNWLVPELFSGPKIKFKHALGIMALSFLLFGGFRGGNHWGNHHKIQDGNCLQQEQCDTEKNNIK